MYKDKDGNCHQDSAGESVFCAGANAMQIRCRICCQPIRQDVRFSQESTPLWTHVNEERNNDHEPVPPAAYNELVRLSPRSLYLP